MIATLLIGIIPFTSCAQNNKGKEQNMDNKKKLVVYFLAQEKIMPLATSRRVIRISSPT